MGPTVPDVLFTLHPSIALQGKVVNAETDKSVDRATVEFAAVDPKTGEATKWTSLPKNELGLLHGDLIVNFPVAEAEAYKIRIRAEGYEPFVSRAIRRAERSVLNFDIKLNRAKAGDSPSATVSDLDGKPLVGAGLLQLY